MIALKRSELLSILTQDKDLWVRILSNLVNELSSLNYLDVTGIWEQWNIDIQDDLRQWDTIEGNVLVIPEPASLLFLAGGILVIKKFCNPIK